MSPPVTFFVGENGSGKSTLLEALALAARSITVGSANAENDETLKSVGELVGDAVPGSSGPVELSEAVCVPAGEFGLVERKFLVLFDL